MYGNSECKNMKIYTIMATWFGSGFAPKASGTAGSIAALPFVWALREFSGADAVLAFAIATFFIGWLATWKYMQTGTSSDPKEVVIDEVSGIALMLYFMPHTLLGYVAGFLLFRIFDILKPWPISIADRKLKSAFGVMIDDIMAGIYPVLILSALALFLPVWEYLR